LLKRLRAIERKDTDSSLSIAGAKEKQQLTDALIVSINGIAQGMRNSG
jgi:phosphoenolpyruvate carboxylase